MQFLNSISGEALFFELFIYIVEAYFIEFVDSHSDINNFICGIYPFGETGKDFTVVNLHHHIDTEFGKRPVNHLYTFRLVNQGVGAHNIGITLEEFAVTPFLRTVGTPHRLYLKSLERESYLITVLHHIASKRHGKVVTKALFTNHISKADAVSREQILILKLRSPIA